MSTRAHLGKSQEAEPLRLGVEAVGELLGGLLRHEGLAMEVDLLLVRARVTALLDHPLLVWRGEARRREEAHEEGVALAAVAEQPLRDLDVVQSTQWA